MKAEQSEGPAQEDAAPQEEQSEAETPLATGTAEDGQEEDTYQAGEGRFVQDVIIAYGKTEEDAKNWLKANKWEPIKGNSDFNAGKASFFDDNKLQDQNVVAVMGIRRTDKAEEAITDMAVMNMKGGYSFQDYENLLKEKKAEIKEFVNNFQVVIDEFRDNYNGKGSDFGKKRADLSFQILNQFYDGDPEGRYAVSDTGLKLGDLLLDKTKQEGNKKGADLEQMVLESSGPALLIVESLLVMGSDTAKETWLKRASGLTGDELTKNLEKYVPEAKGQDIAPSAAKQFLKQHYGDTARDLSKQWKQINELMLWYEEYNEKNGLWQEDGESDEDYDVRVDKFFEDLGKENQERQEEERGRYITASVLYYHLYETEFRGKWGDTMGDFFNPAEDSGFADDPDSFLPMAAALSSGQRAGLDFVSLQTLLLIGCGSEKGLKQMAPETKSLFAGDTEMDIYAGVDRGAFRNGVALTSAALMEQNMGRGNAFNEMWSNLGTVAMSSYAAAVVGAITFSVGAALKAGGTKIVGRSSSASIKLQKDMLNGARADYSNYMKGLRSGKESQGMEEYYLNRVKAFEKTYEDAKGQKVVNSAGSAGRWFMGIGGALLVGAAAVKGVQMYKYYQRDMTPIPLMIVDESDIVTYEVDENGDPVKDENGEQQKNIDFNTYEYYTAVKCNRPEVGEIGDWQNGVKEYQDHGCYDVADLNADMGQEWLALYIVRSSSKGFPILADTLTLQYGSKDMPKGCTQGLHLFTYPNPADLADTAYAFNNKMNGVYFFWGAEEKAGDKGAASAFTGGSLAIACGLGLLIGMILTAVVIKRKRKNA